MSRVRAIFGDNVRFGVSGSGALHRGALAWLSRWRLRRDIDDLTTSVANLLARIDSIEDHHVTVAGDIIDRVRTAREATDAHHR